MLHAKIYSVKANFFCGFCVRQDTMCSLLVGLSLFQIAPGCVDNFFTLSDILVTMMSCFAAGSRHAFLTGCKSKQQDMVFYFFSIF